MLTAVVVLPTPPFWFAIAYTVPIGPPTLPVPKGRFFATTRPCGAASSGVGPALAQHVQVAVAAARVGPDPAHLDGLIASRGAARPSSASSSSSRRPFHATSTPPSASRGDASSASVASRPTARAVTASYASPPSGAGRPRLRALADHARVRTPASDLAATDELALAADRLDQVHPRLGQRGGQDEAGQAGARRPRRRSCAPRSSRTSSPPSESATWTRHAPAGSRTALGAPRSVASRSTSVAERRRASDPEVATPRAPRSSLTR